MHKTMLIFGLALAMLVAPAKSFAGGKQVTEHDPDPDVLKKKCEDQKKVSDQGFGYAALFGIMQGFADSDKRAKERNKKC